MFSCRKKQILIDCGMELAEIWRNELHRMALWLQLGGILEPLPSEEFRGRMNLNMYVQLGRKDISDGCFAMRLGLAGLFLVNY